MRNINQDNTWEVPPNINLDKEELNRVEERIQNEALGFNTPVNILIAGNSGDGKSTLANSMLGVNIADTGIGFPVTKGIKCYKYPGKPLTLFDTEGYEVLDSERTVGAVKELIESRRKNTDEKEHIHVVWLCISATSRRLQQVHINLVNLCCQLQIPIIVVVTKSYLKDDSSEAFINTLIQSLKGVDGIIPVLAKEKQLGTFRISPFGLVDLLDLTLKLIPTGCQAALKFAQIADFNRKLEAANEVVNTTAIAAFGLSFPASFVPGGHAGLLIPLEVRMINQINKTLGIGLEQHQKMAIAKGTIGIVMATLGGRLIFVETIKIIPFVGQISSMLVGGAIAGTIVKVFGTAYIAAIRGMAKSGEATNTSAIVDAITSALSSNQQDFISSATKLLGNPTKQRK